MAHEALKFNVIVDNYKDWQPIVGNQDFGTFYMIYVKFDKPTIQNGRYKYFIKLKLQNYSGNITLGFEGNPRLIELSPAAKQRNVEKLKKLIPDFDTKTPEEQKYLLEIHRIDFQLDIWVRPFDTSKSLKGNVLETNCIIGSPNSDLYNQNNPLSSKFINPYHYQRAGDEILEVGLRNINSDSDFVSVSGAGTLLTRCNPSRSFLL